MEATNCCEVIRVSEIHISESYGLKNKDRIWIDPSILDALRLLAEGKSITDVAGTLRKDRSNLSRTLKKFREQDYPKLCAFLDAIRKESLLEKSSLKERKQKALDARILEVEKGHYYGPPVFGFTIKHGKLAENEDSKKVERVLRGLLAGKRPMEVAKENDLSLNQVYRIRSNRIYMGEFVFMGRTYRGNWKPLITAEEWNDLQRRIGPGGRLLVGYEWRDGKRVLKQGAREMFQEIFRMRLSKEPCKKIGERMGLPRQAVEKIIKDSRITGRMEVDGKLVDSGFEAAVDEEMWKAAQKIRAQTRAERRAEESRELRQRIMGLMPAFRWELVEKTKASESSIEHNVQRLKKEKMLKQREDGLLQKAWEPFPEKHVETARKSWSAKRRRILELLNAEGPLTPAEIAHKTGINYRSVLWNVRKLISEGFVSKEKVQKTVNKKRNKILASLSRGAEKTVSQIAQETNLSEDSVLRHLHLLEKNGFVERILSKRERKGAVPFPTKWRVRTE
jgi:DNA-binding MarR family transcriptional regulator/DNA invertase Pin-like site-specific DNA recombinase